MAQSALLSHLCHQQLLSDSAFQSRRVHYLTGNDFTRRPRQFY